jgi:alanine racemase
LSYIEISKSNLIHNIKTFRKYINPNTKLAAVVKANAYGHGQNEVAAVINDYVDYFQVDDFSEFISLKNLVSKPILILGYISKAEIQETVRSNAIIAVYDIEKLRLIDQAACRLGTKAKVHIKIDAELGRQGLLLSELPEFIDECKRCNYIEFDGVYSHFANIEDVDDFSHAQVQIDAFGKALELFKAAGFNKLMTHMSATSGIIVYDKNLTKNNIVRLGLGLYGMWPSDNLKNKYQDKIELKPIIKWVTHVAQVKTLPTGHSIGYGLTYITDKPTKIAIVPQGYSDGYDRRFSNVGQVLIHGNRCDVVGRVAMNIFVVNISEIDDVKVEDEVVILGKQGSENISAEELAGKIGTINYEITARISSLLPRIIE